MNQIVKILFAYHHRAHEFDIGDNCHPKIWGTVIASASVNKRALDSIGAKYYESSFFIQLYVIRSVAYATEEKELFTNTYLPIIYNWYRDMRDRSETSPSGIENMLIEWHNERFIVHQYRYH